MYKGIDVVYYWGSDSSHKMGEDCILSFIVMII